MPAQGEGLKGESSEREKKAWQWWLDIEPARAKRKTVAGTAVRGALSPDRSSAHVARFARLDPLPADCEPTYMRMI